MSRATPKRGKYHRLSTIISPGGIVLPVKGGEMKDHRIENWENAKKTRINAEKWQDLYKNDKFEISIAHCIPPVLYRAGQQICGGQSY